MRKAWRFIVSGSIPSRLYAAVTPANVLAATESVIWAVTNSRICAFDRTSTFGGRLNLRPTARSIAGTASATWRPYGPSAAGVLSVHATAIAAAVVRATARYI